MSDAPVQCSLFDVATLPVVRAPAKPLPAPLPNYGFQIADFRGVYGAANHDTMRSLHRASIGLSRHAAEFGGVPSDLYDRLNRGELLGSILGMYFIRIAPDQQELWRESMRVMARSPYAQGDILAEQVPAALSDMTRRGMSSFPLEQLNNPAHPRNRLSDALHGSLEQRLEGLGDASRAQLARMLNAPGDGFRPADPNADAKSLGISHYAGPVFGYLKAHFERAHK